MSEESARRSPAGHFFAYFLLTSKGKTATIECVKCEEEDEYPIQTAQRAAALVKGGQGGRGKDHLRAAGLNRVSPGGSARYRAHECRTLVRNRSGTAEVCAFVSYGRQRRFVIRSVEAKACEEAWTGARASEGRKRPGDQPESEGKRPNGQAFA